MTQWARLENGVVAELSPRPFKLHPALMDVQEVPAEWRRLIARGCRFVQGSFRPPVTIDPANGGTIDDLDWLRERATEAIGELAKTARRKLAGTDDMIEIASWSSKEQMAARYRATATTAADDLALQEEATRRGETVEDLVTRIETKAAAYKSTIAEIDGRRKEAEIALAAAGDDLPAILQALADHKAAAEQALATKLQALAAIHAA